MSLNIFMRQTLADDFWGLHKNMNCAFPLITTERSQAGIRKGHLEVSRSQVFFKKTVLKNLAIFTGKHLC